MTDVKMPEPHLTGGSFLPISNMQGSSDGFTEAQLKQYGDDRARDVLVMAAAICYRNAHITSGDEILALAKEIK